MAALRHLVLLVFVLLAALFVPGVASAKAAGSSAMSETRAAAEHRFDLGLRWGPGEIADFLLAAKEGFLSSDEFEQAAAKIFGGKLGRLPLSKPRATGVTDVEIDLISDDVLTQVKRVTSPDATFGQRMQEQFLMTVDAAQLSGRSKIRYIVAEETPSSFVDEIRSMPLPEGMSLSIERISAKR